MDINIAEPLSAENIALLKATAKSCRRTIIAMLQQSQSGHPGGSLSCIDYLTLLYTNIISQTGEKIVVSNGHISPGVYSILAEMGYIPKQEVIDTFRQVGSIYEGHVTRHVPGIYYGTGPLGVGTSAAAGFALAEKLQGRPGKVFGLMGDGEAQEGQVHEMIHFANKYQLDNLIFFVDFNQVQLTASLEEIMPLDLKATFEAANWHVIEVDGHDFEALWAALGEAYQQKKPVVLIGQTIMGKGIPFLEGEGVQHKATWHGKAPSPEECQKILDEELVLSPEEANQLKQLNQHVQWQPEEPHLEVSLTKNASVDIGEPTTYPADKITDCRSAYGSALLDLAQRNPRIVALTADLRDSVKTGDVAKELPQQHIEVGIAEQNMLSVSGGMSLDGFIPFCSTFGAFMSSRAKDQARVNDINQTNVKMVATHCGLSVGEDGPTHQAIDDISSFFGFFNTMIIEPADPNQTDHIIRYVASHYGNFYVRMGRHKYPIVTKEDGSPFYDADYVYEYGRSDIIRKGNDVTVVASGAMIAEALKAIDQLKQEGSTISVELIASTSSKKIDQKILESVKRTKKVITCEDHNTVSGLSSQLAKALVQNNIHVDVYKNIAVKEYQLSGKAEDLYKHAGISSEAIATACKNIM